MNYNNFRIVGKRLNFLSLKRQLHDRKLPFITNKYKKNGSCRLDWCKKSKKSRYIISKIRKYREPCRITILHIYKQDRLRR